MKISPQWLREFVDYKVTPRQLADDLTLAGIAVESVSGGDHAVFEMDITTNRVDAMNHYGIAREISAIYDLELKPLQAKLPAIKDKGKSAFPIEIQVPQFCSRFTGQVIREVKIGASGERVQKRFRSEMDITTNRVDAMNHYGIAREISAIYDLELKPLQAKLPAIKDKGKSAFPIEIQVPQFCSRFTGQVIREVKIGASGERVQKRF